MRPERKNDRPIAAWIPLPKESIQQETSIFPFGQNLFLQSFLPTLKLYLFEVHPPKEAVFSLLPRFPLRPPPRSVLVYFHRTSLAYVLTSAFCQLSSPHRRVLPERGETSLCRTSPFPNRSRYHPGRKRQLLFSVPGDLRPMNIDFRKN